MTQEKENCPKSDVILSENRCRAASAKLGVDFGEVWSASNYQAGCYFYLNVDVNETFFNLFLEPSSTKSEIFGSSRGVCERKGNNF